MGGLVDDLMEHQINVVLGTAQRLQSWAASNDVAKPLTTQKEDDPCNDFAQEMVRCISDLPPPKVSFTGTTLKCPLYVVQVQVQTFFWTDTEFLKLLAFAVKLDRVPEMSKKKAVYQQKYWPGHK